MRKIILAVCVILSGIAVNAQTLLLPTDKEATIKAESSNTVSAILNLKLLDRPPGKAVKLSFKDFNDGDATLGKDYQYPISSDLNDQTITDATGQTFSIHVSILPVKTDAKQKYFNLYISYERDKFPVTEKLKVTIDYTVTKLKPDIDTSKWAVSAIVGSNLDFFNTPVFKNFAGEIKVYVPSFATMKVGKGNWHFGLITGLFNYQYFEADSSNGNVQFENYLLDPTVHVPIVDTTKYIRHIYALNSNISYNNWGAYLDPMVRIAHNDWFDLFFDLHFEAIWRTRITKNTILDIRRDTFTLSKPDTAHHIALQAFQAIRPLYREEDYVDFYEGIGLPFNLNVKNAFSVYLNPAFGITNFNKLKLDSQRVGGVTIYNYVTSTSFVPFALMKFQLTTKVAPVDIVVGGEIRYIAKKQFDKNIAYKAFYLAAVISLDKLKK